MIEKVEKLQRSKTLTQPKTAAVINDKTVEYERNNIHGYGCSAVINDKTVENEGNNFHGYGCLEVINDETVENDLKIIEKMSWMFDVFFLHKKHKLVKCWCLLEKGGHHTT